MSVLSMQDEIELAAYQAVEQLNNDLQSGMFTPSQAQHVLGIIQTSFNGLISGKDFLDLMTSMSEEIAAMATPVTARIYTLNHSAKGAAIITMKGSIGKWEMPGAKPVIKKFESEAEAAQWCNKAVTLLISKGFNKGAQ